MNLVYYIIIINKYFMIKKSVFISKKNEQNKLNLTNH